MVVVVVVAQHGLLCLTTKCVSVCVPRSLLVICFPAPYLIFPDEAH